MFEEMRSRGLTDPMYEEKRGSTRLILSSIPRLAPDVEARLPASSERVLDLIRAAGNTRMGTGDIAYALDMSRPAVKRRLDALADEGLIEWVGKSPKDPRAHWTVKNT